MMNNVTVACWCLLMLTACDDTQQGPPAPLSVAAALGAIDNRGFKQAETVREFVFPDDHGAHPEYKTEWWYLTGNVTTAAGREFGYQFTLFRNAIAVPVSAGEAGAQQPHPSNWSTSQIYMAHAALSDIQSGKFYHDEQFSRGALGLAGAGVRPLKLWLQQWSVTGREEQCPDCLVLEVAVATGDFRLQLQLHNTQPIVLHGERGLSAKSAVPGNASYYYSYTRLQTNGQIYLGATGYPVSGESWFDHEWSTSALARGQEGWDWYALQLSNRTELMIFRLRHRTDPQQDYLYGSLVRNGGDQQTLNGTAIKIQSSHTWHSTASGVTYPSAWDIEVPGYKLAITPKMPDHEVNNSFRYWEGAVVVAGTTDGQTVTGHGYVELTGYR